MINHIADNSPLLQGRLYPNIIPQNTKMPAAVYTVINNRDDQCTTTGQAYKSVQRFQIDIYAKTYKEVQQITTEVKNSLYSFNNTPFDISNRDGFETDSELFRQIIEFKIRN